MKRKLLNFLMIAFVAAAPPSMAQSGFTAPGNNTNPYHYGVKGTRLFDGHIQYVYNDDLYASPPKKPCGRKFFFVTYQNEPTEFELQAVVPNSYNDFTVWVWENGVHTQTIPDVDQNEPFQLSFANSGTMEIAFISSDPNAANTHPGVNIATVVEVIPRIEKIWLETPEICLNDWPAGQPIPVELKTIPAFQNVIHWADGHPFWNGVNCVEGDNLWFKLEHLHNVNVQSMTNGVIFANYTTQPIYDFSGFISYADAGPYFAGGSSIPLTFKFTDGVTEWTVNHKIKITGPPGTVDPWVNDWWDEWDMHIWGSEAWTATDNPSKNHYSVAKDRLRINKDLIIHKGATLSISDMTLEFGPQGRIILEAEPNSTQYGSALLLSNTHLTAFRDCGNEDRMWQGVVVKGNASQGQQPISPNYNGVDRYQGMLVMNHSEISYAHEAVRLWAADKSYFDADGDGGIVIANNSRFYNNRRSAEFMKYSYTDPNNPNLALNNRSRFIDCNFEVDADYPGNDFWGFISGWAVRGIGISGCTFRNTGYQRGATRGIFGQDFGVSIGQKSALSSSPSVFENLTVAVENQYLGGPASLSVTNSLFGENSVGIVSAGVMAPRITGNEIYTTSSQGYGSFTKGIHINTGSGYDISNNSIQGGDIGVLVSKSGSDPNLVRKNVFTMLGVGGLSNYKNRDNASQSKDGLQFLCNTYDALDYGIAAMGDPSTDGIAPEQGSFIDPTGNSLYPSSAVNLYNQAGAINYYYNNSDPAPSTAGNVMVVQGSRDNYCTEMNFSNNPDQVFTGDLPMPYSGFMRVMLDTAGASRDSLHYWAGQWQSPYGDLIRTDLLMEEGASGEALAFYSGIIDRYKMDDAEKKEFVEYGSQLIGLRAALAESGQHMKQLSGDQVRLLEAVAAEAKLWAKVRAQQWLTLFDGRDWEQDILYPEDGPAARPALPQATTHVTHANGVYPNPVRNSLQVYYATDSDEAISLLLLDLLGRKVLSVPLKKGVNTVNTKDLRSGVYYYKVMEGAAVKMNGKLVKE